MNSLNIGTTKTFDRTIHKNQFTSVIVVEKNENPLKYIIKAANIKFQSKNGGIKISYVFLTQAKGFSRFFNIIAPNVINRRGNAKLVTSLVKAYINLCDDSIPKPTLAMLYIEMKIKANALILLI